LTFNPHCESLIAHIVWKVQAKIRAIGLSRKPPLANDLGVKRTLIAQ